MAIPLDINGTEFQYPEVDDVAWGPDATDWAVAVTTGMLQKAGGLFILLDDVDFGASFGLISSHYTSRSADAASAGAVRLANLDAIAWRNFSDDGDLDLTVSGSDTLLFNGLPIGNIASVTDTATIDLTLAGTALSADIIALSITNALISASAAIAYSKLALTDSILNADINSAAAIAYSKLSLTGSIVNADVNASAAIATSKLAALTASRAVVSDGSGFISSATTTATEIGYVNGVTSAIQTQLDAKQATGNYITALTTDVVASGPGSVAATIQSNVVTNAKLAQMPTLTIKGNNTGGTANTLDLSVAQVNTMLGSLSNPMTTAGDVIYGGVAGLATRLAIGAASKVLRSDGTNPSWDFPEPTLTTKTTTYTLVANDNLLLASGSGGAFTLTLPAAAAGNTGKRYTFKRTDSSFANVITITDGTFTTTMNTLGETLEVYSTGSAWVEFRRTIPSVWVSYTPAGSWTTNTSYTGRWRRVGDSAEFQTSWTTSGAPTATNLTLTLPTGIVIDTAKLASTGTVGSTGVQSLGTVQYSDVGVRAFQGHVTYSGNTANVAVTYSDPAAATNNCTQASPFTWASNDSGSAIFRVPVTGWNG